MHRKTQQKEISRGRVLDPGVAPMSWELALLDFHPCSLLTAHHPESLSCCQISQTRILWQEQGLVTRTEPTQI